MNTVVIIGTGLIGIEHAKAAHRAGWEPILISRSAEKARTVESTTGFKVLSTDIANIKEHFRENFPTHCVIAVPVTVLAKTAHDAAAAGFRYLLLEKPAVLHQAELADLQSNLDRYSARAWVAYNRRGYESVAELRKRCAEDGGITSIHFEFTEWSHVIESLKDTPKEIKDNWLLANSSHVIDLAFFIAGAPKHLSHYKSGGLAWHPSGSVFVGSGITDQGILFSYNANWESAGRWGVEVCTKKAKYILRPLEGLQIMRRGSVAIEPVTLDDAIDRELKAGFFVQMSAFLDAHNNNFNKMLCDLDTHARHIKFYNQINDASTP